MARLLASAALWKSVRRFPAKIGIELLCDPALPLLGVLPKDAASSLRVTAALFTVAERSQPRVC